jgi:ribosomal protein L7/L12
MDLHTPAYTLLHLLAALLAGFIIGRITAGTSDPRRREAKKREQRTAELAVREQVRTLPPDLRMRTERLLAEGKIIEAIRDVRLETGLGLKESKDLVELLRDETSRGARAP